MKSSVKLIAGASLMLFIAGTVQAINFLNTTGGDWSSMTWSDGAGAAHPAGTVPGLTPASDFVYIANGQEVTYGAPSGTINRLYIGEEATVANTSVGSGTFTMNSGRLTVSGLYLSIGNTVSGTDVLNLRGGLMEMTSANTSARLILGNAAGATGLVNVTGGTISPTVIAIGYTVGSRGELYMSSGKIDGSNALAHLYMGRRVSGTTYAYYEQTGGHFIHKGDFVVYIGGANAGNNDQHSTAAVLITGGTFEAKVSVGGMATSGYGKLTIGPDANIKAATGATSAGIAVYDTGELIYRLGATANFNPVDMRLATLSFAVSFTENAKLTINGASLGYLDGLSGMTLMQYNSGKGASAGSIANVALNTTFSNFDSRYDPFLSWRPTSLKLYLYGDPFSHWVGGNGTWDNVSLAGSGTWYDAEHIESDKWSGRTAIFAGTSGTVTVDSAASEVVFQGAKFNTTGYVIESGSLTTTIPAATLSTTTAVTARIDSIIAGSGGIEKTGAGTLILGGDNTYGGATVISGGTLQIGAGGASGNIRADITNNAMLVFNRSDSFTLDGVISGTGKVLQEGTGKTVLAADNTYTGTTTIASGTLQIGAGGASGSVTGTIFNNSALALNRSDNYNFNNAIVGTGAVHFEGTGTTTLAGKYTYTGATTISNGVLNLTGALGAASAVTVRDFGRLTGTGTALGAVTLAADGILQGRAGQKLTLASLTMTADSKIIASLDAAPGITPAEALGTELFNVLGNLTLDGTLDVTDLGDFGPGVYRLFTYGGTLFDNILEIGAAPGANNLSIVAGGGFVDLVFSATTTNYWKGGAGTWSADTSIKQWTNATASMTPEEWATQFAVFKHPPSGTVTVSNAAGAVGFEGMQFLADGFVITGGSLTTSGTNGKVRIQVGDGPGGASFVTKIGSIITGTHAVEKEYAGKLVFTGSNNYTGNTIITGGVLQLGDGGAIGSINGNVDNKATLAFNRSDAYVFGGTISGTGAVRQEGAGKTVLTANNTYTGLTTIAGGTLQIGNGGATGSVAGNIANNSTLIFNRSDAYTYSGTIIGGFIRQEGAGTLILTGNNTDNGRVTIASGTLQLGNGGTTGSIAIGGFTNNSALAVNRSDNFTFSNIIEGSGAFYQNGSGKTTLSGAHTYTGATVVNAGELNLTGALSAASTVTVGSGAKLSGSGTAAGAVVVRSGGALYGASGNLFTMGSLTMDAGSVLNVSLGAPPANEAAVEADRGLFQVNGDVSLSGTLNVTNIGGFGAGIYRIINYTGNLLGNSMVLGTRPPGANASDLSINTTIANRVNLVFTGSLALMEWKGGAGTWSAVSSGTNWDLNGMPVAWVAATAVFAANPGTVTIDSSVGEVSATKIQFANDGFVVDALAGSALTVHSATTMIQVGDGSADGAGMTATISAPITGDGGIHKVDLGTLVLSGTNTYAAGTRVSGGVLQVASDASLGAASGTLTLNGGTLRAAAALASARAITITATGGTIDTGANEVALSGLISGAGALTKIGTGRLIVSNNANTLTGLTTVRAGELILRSGKLGATTIQAGAALRGAGSIGALTNGGLVSPGETDGELATINVAGTFTQQATGHAFMEVASLTSFDQVRATGNITVGGMLTVQMLDGYIPTPGQTFTLFATTASVSGTFASIKASDMGMLKFMGANLNGTGYQLTVVQDSFSSITGSKNEKSIAGAMDTAVAAGELTDLRHAFATYTTTADVRAGLDQLSAAPYAHWFQQAVYMTDATTRAAGNRLASSTGGPRDVWIEYTRNETKYDATNETAAAEVVTDGFLLGADFPTSKNLRLGVLFGYDVETLTYDNLGSSGEADRYIAALYGRITGREYFVDTVIGGAWAKVDTTRVISLPGYSRIAKSMANESEFFAHIRAGFPVTFGNFVTTPYLQAQYVNWSMGGFEEEDADEANLTVQRQSNGSFAGTFGLNFHMPFDLFGIQWTPRLDLGLRHEFRDKSSAKVTAMIGGAPYTVRCSEGRATGYVATLGLDAIIFERVTAYLRVTSEKDTAIDEAYDIRAGFELRF